MRQVRMVMLSTLMMLLCGLLSHAQDANNAIEQGPRSEVTGGTTDFIPLWLSATKLGSSKMFQSTAGDVGVGTTSPAFTLDVDGTINAATRYNLAGSPFDYVTRGAVDHNGDLFFGHVGSYPCGIFRVAMPAGRKRENAHLPLRVWG